MPLKLKFEDPLEEQLGTVIVEALKRDIQKLPSDLNVKQDILVRFLDTLRVIHTSWPSNMKLDLDGGLNRAFSAAHCVYACQLNVEMQRPKTKTVREARKNIYEHAQSSVRSAATTLSKCFLVYGSATTAMDTSKVYCSAGIKDDIATKLFEDARQKLEENLPDVFDDMVVFMESGNEGGPQSWTSFSEHVLGPIQTFQTKMLRAIESWAADSLQEKELDIADAFDNIFELVQLGLHLLLDRARSEYRSILGMPEQVEAAQKDHMPAQQAQPVTYEQDESFDENAPVDVDEPEADEAAEPDIAREGDAGMADPGAEEAPGLEQQADAELEPQQFRELEPQKLWESSQFDWAQIGDRLQSLQKQSDTFVTQLMEIVTSGCTCWDVAKKRVQGYGDQAPVRLQPSMISDILGQNKETIDIMLKFTKATTDLLMKGPLTEDTWSQADNASMLEDLRNFVAPFQLLLSSSHTQSFGVSCSSVYELEGAMPPSPAEYFDTFFHTFGKKAYRDYVMVALHTWTTAVMKDPVRLASMADDVLKVTLGLERYSIPSPFGDPADPFEALSRCAGFGR